MEVFERIREDHDIPILVDVIALSDAAIGTEQVLEQLGLS